jgi:NAD(P)-dependent dehydrogenase (short-subunit alcohol dehydrogenase family)
VANGIPAAGVRSARAHCSAGQRLHRAEHQPAGAHVPGQHLQLLLDQPGGHPAPADGGAIINTSSINGLRGNKSLIDYAATKGAVLAFTYSLAQAMLDRGIRVNSVAPGPVWTPLIPATFGADKVSGFGSQAPMGRAAHPDEIAPSYVFFAAGRLSSYYSGEVLAPVGGETLPG